MKTNIENLADLANRVIETTVETAKTAEKKGIRTGVKAGEFSDARLK